MSSKYPNFLTECVVHPAYTQEHQPWLQSYHQTKLVKTWKRELAVTGSQYLARTNTWESKLDSATTSFWSIFTGIGSGSHSSPAAIQPRNPKFDSEQSTTTTIEQAFKFFIFQRYSPKTAVSRPNKALIRNGIPEHWRNRVWCALVAVDLFLENHPDVYFHCLDKVFHYPLEKSIVKPKPSPSIKTTMTSPIPTPETTSKARTASSSTTVTVNPTNTSLESSSSTPTMPNEQPPTNVEEQDVDNVMEHVDSADILAENPETDGDFVLVGASPQTSQKASKPKPVSYTPTGNWLSKLGEPSPPSYDPSTTNSTSSASSSSGGASSSILSSFLPASLSTTTNHQSIFGTQNSKQSWSVMEQPAVPPSKHDYDEHFPIGKLLNLVGVGGVPHFGGHMAPHAHILSLSGVESCLRIMLAIQSNFPGITYCPPLLHITEFALLYMNERDAYLFTHNIVATSLIDRFFVNTTIQNYELFIYSFTKLVSTHIKSLYTHLTQISFDLDALAHTWLSHFFLTFLPLGIVLMIFDCFVSEGYKVLYRFGLALLYIMEPDLSKCKTSEEAIKIVTDCYSRFDSEDEKNNLWKISFQFKFSRKTTQKFEELSRHNDTMRSLLDITSSVHKTTALSLNRTKSLETLKSKSKTVPGVSPPPSPETSTKGLSHTHSEPASSSTGLLASTITSATTIQATHLVRTTALGTKATVILFNQQMMPSKHSLIPHYPGEEEDDPSNPSDIRHLPLYKRANFLKKPTDHLTHLLVYEELIALWRWLPDRYFARNAQTVFHTHFHGYNLNSLYQACSNSSETDPITGLSRGNAKLTQSINSVVGSPKAARKFKAKEAQILLVRTTKNQLFGAYLSQPITYTLQQYVGTGESFLFTLRPFAKRYGWARGTNNSFYSGLHNSIDFGGNGLTIDETLKHGVTIPTDTFSNTCLTGSPGKKDNFEILDIEVLRLVVK